MDWEFDEDQKLSYNNPVFIELCKRQGKNFDELNTGWVPQHKIGEEPEEEEDEIEEEEDEFEEDEDLDEDELFTDDPKKEEPPKEDDSEVTFKFGSKNPKDETKNESNTKIDVDVPETSMDDLVNLFGGSAPKDETPSFDGPSQPNFGQPSNRERIGAALDEIPGTKPRLKLNIDKTSADQPIAPTPKTTIKLNIKPKNP